MTSYRKWQVGDRGNACMGVAVPGNPASFVDVYLAKSSPVSSNSLSLDSAIHLSSANLGSSLVVEEDYLI